MRPPITRLTVLLLGMASTFTWAGCGPDRADAGSAVIKVPAQALSAVGVDHVTVTISGPGIDSDVVAALSGDPALGWSGVIGAIPVGTGRRFAVQAFGAAGNVLDVGEAGNVDIALGERSFLLILLQRMSSPTSFQNAAPRFRSLMASRLEVAPKGMVLLAADAYDPDPGDVLAYAWTARGGTFSYPMSPGTFWIAPDTDGLYEVTVTARDPKMVSASASVIIKVSTPGGGAQADGGSNAPPVVTGLVPKPARIDVGESTRLLLSASDPDGDLLSFAWIADCPGSFDDPHGARPAFTAGAGASGPECTLAVEISDGRGGYNTASVTIEIGPPIGPNPGTGGSGGAGGMGGGRGGTGGNGGGMGGGGVGGGGMDVVSCSFTNADSTLAAFVVNGMIYGADDVPLGRIQSSIATHTDGSAAGRIVGGTIYDADGSVRAFRKSDLLYSADGTLRATIGATIRRADGAVAGQTGCEDPVTSLAVTLFGVLGL